MLDTLRADHLSGYGYERQTSPVLDSFANENLKFKHALTAAPWTPASVATMFTGLYPTSHGMVPPNDRELAKKGFAKLNPNLETIAEVLKQQGYTTAGVSPNPWITKEFGYTQGFDEFYYIARKPAEKITESGEEIITKWLNDKSSKKSSDPFFLYLHYLDPHDPYTPPPPYDTKFQGPLLKSPFTYDEKMLSLIGRYDGEINYMDTQLGRLFSFLKEKELYEDLFIVIVSDHGEQFKEHGNLRHGYKLFNEEVHIPLLIKTNRKSDSAKIIETTVSTVDIYPTILARLGITPPKNLQGVSLLNEKAIKDRKSVISEVRRIYDMKSVTDFHGKHLVMEVPYDQKDPDVSKSLESWRSPNIIGLFDSHNDYACMTKMKDPQLKSELKSSFDEIFLTALKNQSVATSERSEEISNETLDQLKSLGYLQ